MGQGFRLFEFADNPVLWAIIVLALFCFILQFNLLIAERTAEWKRQAGTWLRVLPVLLSALPLLGLLGTIAGLLGTFRVMSVAGGLDQQLLLSSGIAAALITTQLGLIMVIPGLLLLTWVRARYRGYTGA
jgi:biopolymer transport protein ExbB